MNRAERETQVVLPIDTDRIYVACPDCDGEEHAVSVDARGSVHMHDHTWAEYRTWRIAHVLAGGRRSGSSAPFACFTFVGSVLGDLPWSIVEHIPALRGVRSRGINRAGKRVRANRVALWESTLENRIAKRAGYIMVKYHLWSQFSLDRSTRPAEVGEALREFGTTPVRLVKAHQLVGQLVPYRRSSMVAIMDVLSLPEGRRAGRAVAWVPTLGGERRAAFVRLSRNSKWWAASPLPKKQCEREGLSLRRAS